MSSGSISQIHSNENIVFYLNPQITYFKSVYRKYTKFSINETEETTDQNAFSSSSAQIDIPINIHGDLLSEISIKMVLNDDTGIDVETSNIVPYNAGTHLIDIINFKIDNLEVESVDHRYINIKGMLNNKKSINPEYNIINNELVCINGNNYQRNSLSGSIKKYTDTSLLKKLTSLLPLPFSFSRSTGTALPIFMLSDRNIPKIEIRKKTNLDSNTIFSNGNLNKFKFSLICKFITLSEEEKYRFQSSDQIYLLEKIKLPSHHNISITSDGELISLKNRVPNLPIKTMYIYNNSINTNTDTNTHYFLYSKMNYEFFIRGVNLYSEPISHEYFSKLNLVENFKHCDGIHYDNDSYKKNEINNNIAFINFSLKETEGPSGSINTGMNDLSFRCSFDSSFIQISEISNDNHIEVLLYIVYYCLIRFTTDGRVIYPYGG